MQLALLVEDFKDTRAWFREILEEGFYVKYIAKISDIP